jgi:monoterpene epsilon-lactone hydrolase
VTPEVIAPANRNRLLVPMHGSSAGGALTLEMILKAKQEVLPHRKLRQAGVEAVLPVFEGQSRAQYYRDDTSPEARDAFEEIAGFFDRHLGK